MHQMCGKIWCTTTWYHVVLDCSFRDTDCALHVRDKKCWASTGVDSAREITSDRSRGFSTEFLARDRDNENDGEIEREK